MGEWVVGRKSREWGVGRRNKGGGERCYEESTR